MATLLSAVTSDTTGSAVSHTSPCTVFVRGTLDGATVTIQISDDGTNFVKIDNASLPNPARFDAPGSVGIDGKGTYHLRAVLQNAGSSTSVTVVTTL